MEASMGLTDKSHLTISPPVTYEACVQKNYQETVKVLVSHAQQLYRRRTSTLSEPGVRRYRVLRLLGT